MAPEDTRFILLVENDAPLRNLVTRMLECQGYRVRAAADGQVAADLFHADPEGVALLLTDLEMPGKNGIELIQEIRVVRPELPVVLMSGNLDECSEELRGIPSMAKPFTIETLMRAVEKYLKSGEAAVLAS